MKLYVFIKKKLRHFFFPLHCIFMSNFEPKIMKMNQRSQVNHKKSIGSLISYALELLGLLCSSKKNCYAYATVTHFYS